MNSRDIGFLEDILDAARIATSYVSGVTEDQFRADRGKQDSVMYRVGIIGEAAKNVSEDTKKLLALNWPAMTGMRNRLFHGYREVRVGVVWTTVTVDLPRVIAVIEPFLAR